jgi:hypothetical protein
MEVIARLMPPHVLTPLADQRSAEKVSELKGSIGVVTVSPFVTLVRLHASVTQDPQRR